MVVVLSAIHPFNHPLTLNFPWSLGYIRKLALGSLWGQLYYSRFCVQTTYGAHEFQTCTDTALSGYQFTPRSSGDSFLVPEKFTLGQCRIRTMDILISSRTRNHWMNGPRLIISPMKVKWKGFNVYIQSMLPLFYYQIRTTDFTNDKINITWYVCMVRMVINI